MKTNRKRCGICGIFIGKNENKVFAEYGYCYTCGLRKCGIKSEEDIEFKPLAAEEACQIILEYRQWKYGL